MAGAHDGRDRLLDQRLVAQVALVVAREQAADHHVELALREAVDQHVAGLDLQADAQRRVRGLDLRHGLRQQRDRRRGDRADAHRAEAAGLQRVDLLVRLAQAGQRHARVANHGFPVPRWAHATREAVEQLHLEHVLEVLQQLRGRRLRHVQHLRGAVDVAFFLHRHEEKQLARRDKGTFIGIAMPTKSSARWIADGDNMVKVLQAGLQDRPAIRRRRHPEPARADREHGHQGRQGAGDRAIDGTTLSDVLQKAADKGIKVIAYDRLIKGSKNVDYYATFDNFQVGVLQAGSIETGARLNAARARSTSSCSAARPTTTTPSSSTTARCRC
jgi:hypothetical protein